jgi:LysR family transcriptional regulator, glycine cleavage system transcriptional activator
MVAPFHLLHTFVVVVRSRRMDRAAETLGLTPGAISQRIKELEQRLQLRLLDRSRSGLTLTRSGDKLYRSVAGPLDQAAAGYAAVSGGGASKRIVINTVPSFAALWLVPRLGSFTGAHPEIEIAIETDTRVIDLTADPVDLVIRHGLGRYDGLTSHWLMAPELVVIASPKLLRSGPPIERLADCLHYPLLQDIERNDWRMLFEAMRIRASVPETGTAYADDHLLVRAAAAGQGLALVSTVYANSEIDSGRVMSPLKVRWPMKFAYYLVGRPQTFRRSAVRRFKTWILAEAARNNGG